MKCKYCDNQGTYQFNTATVCSEHRELQSCLQQSELALQGYKDYSAMQEKMMKIYNLTLGK